MEKGKKTSEREKERKKERKLFMIGFVTLLKTFNCVS